MSEFEIVVMHIVLYKGEPVVRNPGTWLHV